MILKCSFLELDVVTITVENTFQWLGGDKNDINAVHLDVMTIKVTFAAVNIIKLTWLWYLVPVCWYR